MYVLEQQIIEFFYQLNQFKKILLIIPVFSALTLIAFSLQGQSLMGHSGLVTIPTARMQEDGSLSFGAAYFDKKYQDYSNRMYHVASVYTSLNFLPFVEITLRVNRMLDFPREADYTVDRVPMIRVRLMKERNLMPAVVIGAHDFYAAYGGEEAKHFNATYVVLSKRIGYLDFHGGYSPVLMDAGHYQLNGFFYGIGYTPFRWVSLMVENDSRITNLGMRMHFLKNFSLNMGLINFDSYAAGINYTLNLSTNRHK